MSVAIENLEDRRIVLANSQVARKLSIGTSWSTLRIGGRVFFDAEPGGALFSRSRFIMGVMTTPTAGVTNGPLSGTACTHFVGVKSSAPAWSDQTDRYWPSGSNYWSQYKDVLGVITAAIQNADVGLPKTAGYRWPFIVQITKGSPNFTIQFVAPNRAGWGAQDLPDGVLETAMNDATMAACVTTINAAVGTGMTFAAVAQTVAVDEAANGDLDSIVVAWDRFWPPMHLSELLFYKVA